MSNKSPLHTANAEILSRFREGERSLIIPPDHEGYRFSWGHVIETRYNDKVHWDICIVELILLYVEQKLHVSYFSRDIFDILQDVAPDHVPIDPKSMNLKNGWYIVPAQSGRIVRVAASLNDEAEARTWIADAFITFIVPDAIQITLDTFGAESFVDNGNPEPWMPVSYRVH